jgi:hypothetical protein
MAVGTGSAFGKPNLSFGPCKLFWDTASGGQYLDLGGFDSCTLSLNVAKIGLRESQAGDRDADKAISAQTYQVSAGLSRATLERMEEVVQGFELEKDTAGVIQRAWVTDIVGCLDSEIRKQLTLHELSKGKLSDNPFDILDIWEVAPMSETTELVFDATSQRFYGVVFEAYRSANHLYDGKETYMATRALGT